MVRSNALIQVEDIARSIHSLRGQRVMLDADLASLYGVTTKRLNEQVKRNERRFPPDFTFKLTPDEYARLRSQNATSKPGRGGPRYAPRALLEPPAEPRKRIGFRPDPPAAKPRQRPPRPGASSPR